nr:unnamed protein product [Callosobruchus analis]
MTLKPRTTSLCVFPLTATAPSPAMATYRPGNRRSKHANNHRVFPLAGNADGTAMTPAGAIAGAGAARFPLLAGRQICPSTGAEVKLLTQNRESYKPSRVAEAIALIGNIEPFSGVAEEFEVYLERMEHLFRVNCVDESLRVSMFVTLAGSKVYQTLKNLVAPTKPSELTYVQIQKPDQSVADYIVELRKLASSCSFGEFLDDALRDRFVCGIRSEQLQRQLLSDDKLSFKTACQRAQAAELAENQVKDLASSTDNPTHAVQRYPEKKYNKSPVTRLNSGMCKNCGRTHGKDQCPAARWKCFACGKYGHVRSRCLQKSSIGAVQEEHSVVVSSEESVSESVVVNEDLYSVQINNVSGMMPAHKVSLAAEGSQVDFEVDTGACKSLMSESMYHKFLGNVNLCKVRYRLNTISGENIKVVGEGMVQVKCKNKEVKLPLIIVESKNEFTPLLGRNWLDILFPNWQHGFKVNTVNSLDKSVIVEAFSREYLKKIYVILSGALKSSLMSKMRLSQL